MRRARGLPTLVRNHRRRADMMEFMTKAYVLKNFALDAIDFIRERVGDIDWDREALLHKAGLTTYRPGKAVFGTVTLFLAGAAVGGILGLAFAPRAGTELRGQIKDKARKMMEDQGMPMGTAHTGTGISGGVAGYDRPR